MSGKAAPVTGLKCEVVYDLQNYNGDEGEFVRSKLGSDAQKTILDQNIQKVCFVVTPIKRGDTSHQDRALEAARSLGYQAHMDEHHKNKVVVDFSK